MPHAVPIREFKDTNAILQMCRNSDEPIYITQEGLGGMVVMSKETYEKKMYMLDVYEKLDEAEADVAVGRTSNAREALKRLREELDV
jgi:PHD/YefM family antitoxin component YafN of YafNO toxin-antitoxin module